MVLSLDLMRIELREMKKEMKKVDGSDGIQKITARIKQFLRVSWKRQINREIKI